MGLDPFTIAGVVSLTAGAVYSADQQQQAAGEQKKSRREQQAIQAAQRAQERRQQIREERVRRARIIQASENSGVTGSAGELGALGSLSTQLQGNIGFSRGMQRSADAISNFQQNAQDAMDRASMGQQVSSLAASIFSASASMPSGKQPPQNYAPVVEAQPRRL